MSIKPVSQWYRIGAAMIAFVLVGALLAACAADPFTAFERKVTGAVRSSGYSKIVGSTGFMQKRPTVWVSLRSTTAELGGSGPASALAGKVATALFARVPELESVTVADKADVKIAKFDRPATK